MVAFDLDGTLTVESSSWRRLHEFFGTERKGEEALREYELGKISYEEFVRRDISAWPKEATVETISGVLSNFVLRQGAEELIYGLKLRKMKVAVVTSGLEALAKRVCERLQIDKYVANDVEADASGRLTGRGIIGVEPFKKDLALLKIAEQLRVSLDETVAVGDTKFDASLLRAARIGVAFAEDGKPDPELLKVANYVITKLTDLLAIVDLANEDCP
ncbi:MAG: HAD-IB family phosphatase [Candidatus Brockarchaeota archaeon]|nr:HAD-IB family phosphatase [Candidatus Brockarchaeota archaeon]